MVVVVMVVVGSDDDDDDDDDGEWSEIPYCVECNCRLWAVEDWGQDWFAREAFVRPWSSVVPKLLVTYNTRHPAWLKASRGRRTACYNYQVILSLFV